MDTRTEPGAHARACSSNAYAHRDSALAPAAGALCDTRPEPYARAHTRPMEGHAHTRSGADTQRHTNSYAHAKLDSYGEALFPSAYMDATYYGDFAPYANAGT